MGGAFPNGIVALLKIAAMALLASGDPAGHHKKRRHLQFTYLNKQKHFKDT